jgi:S-formylglutathione hydrolase FrmB
MPASGRIWRRRLVALGAVGVVAVGVWLLVRGGPESYDALGAQVEDLTIHSEAIGADEPVKVVVPDTGVAHPALLVFLHGRDGDESGELYQPFFDALADAGRQAPMVAFPDGGGSSYWHDRSTGDWGKYVTDEVIPQVVDKFGADPDRIAIGGISMGGYGAYEIAFENPGMFCAVGGHSPALWRTAGETAEGAFDDADDFAAHDVIGQAAQDPGPFTSQPVWLDAGTEDPFLPGDDAFTGELQALDAPITVEHPPGAHESDYWRSHWDAYMRFYAQGLADCS